MARNDLRRDLENYLTADRTEKSFAASFAVLLQHPRAFYRDHLPGHITGSAWIVDESRSFALLTHHAKLNRWLQPGGHADGEENVLQVAIREAVEETGLKTIRPLSTSIFDIDIHTIPARKDFPQHDHYDIRYLFEASMDEPFTITEESHDLKWLPLGEISKLADANESILRMIRKTLHRKAL